MKEKNAISEMTEIMRGHIEECFSHFCRCFLSYVPKHSKKTQKMKRPLAEFCGVHIRTVSEWFRKEKLPIGDAYPRLMCFLNALGYKVLELENLSQTKRNITELIGYDILNIEQLNNLFQYSRVSTIIQILFSDTEPNREKNEALLNCYIEHRVALENKKEKISKELHSFYSFLYSSEENNVSNHVTTIMKSIESLLVILDGKNFHVIPDKEISSLSQSEKKTILRLFNHLQDLKSKVIYYSLFSEEKSHE